MTPSELKDLENLIEKLGSERNLHQMYLDDESLYTGVSSVLKEISYYLNKIKHKK